MSTNGHKLSNDNRLSKGLEQVCAQLSFEFALKSTLEPKALQIGPVNKQPDRFYKVPQIQATTIFASIEKDLHNNQESIPPKNKKFVGREWLPEFKVPIIYLDGKDIPGRKKYL